jgi:hypothetical protein
MKPIKHQVPMAMLDLVTGLTNGNLMRFYLRLYDPFFASLVV